MVLLLFAAAVSGALPAYGYEGLPNSKLPALPPGDAALAPSVVVPDALSALEDVVRTNFGAPGLPPVGVALALRAVLK